MMRTYARFPSGPFARPATWLGVLVATLCAACASSGNGAKSGPPRPIAVSLIGYGPAPFELVSESHTPAVKLYSKEHSTASTKVLNDEAMVGLVRHLEELGYRRYSRPGSAPPSGGRAFTKALQVDENGAISWWPIGESASVAELKAFQTAMHDFIDLYNIAQSWQSVDNTLGGDYFDRKKAGH
jgi:hypothetical protein